MQSHGGDDEPAGVSLCCCALHFASLPIVRTVNDLGAASVSQVPLVI